MIGPDENAHGGESVRLRGVAVLGVDGWRGAWVGALLDGRSVTLHALADVDRRPRRPGRRGGRRSTCRSGCPTTASASLRRRGPLPAARPGAAGSVFPTPVRAVLATDDYAEARAAVPCRDQPAARAVGAGLPTGQGHPRARRRPRRPAARPHRRGAPRTGLPRARPAGARPEGHRPRARSSGCARCARSWTSTRRWPTRRVGRPGDRRTRRLRRRVVGAAPGRRRRGVRGRRPDRRPRAADADLLVNTPPVGNSAPPAAHR